MASLEELKKKQSNIDQEKEASLRAQKRAEYEKIENDFNTVKEEQSNIAEEDKENHEKIEDAKRKKFAASSALKSLIQSIKSEYDRAKSDPDSIFKDFFLKDEKDNLTRNLNVNAIKELDEVMENSKKTKGSSQEIINLNKKKKINEKRKQNLDDLEKKLYPSTEVYLKDRYFNLRDITSTDSFPIKNIDSLIKEQPDQIDHVKEILIEEIDKYFDNLEKQTERYLASFSNSRDRRPYEENLENIKKQRILMKDLQGKRFDKSVLFLKSRQDGIDLDYIRDLENYKKNLSEVENYISQIDFGEKHWTDGERGLDQKIIFGDVYSHPLGITTREKMKKQEDVMSSIQEDLKEKEEELATLEKKKPLFGKEKHHESVRKLRNEVGKIKDSLNTTERYKLQDIQKNSVFDDSGSFGFNILKPVLESNFIAYHGNDTHNNNLRFSEALNEKFKKEIEAGREITLRDYVEAIKSRLEEVKNNLESQKDKYDQYEKDYNKYQELKNDITSLIKALKNN